jgi:hypothetical protein
MEVDLDLGEGRHMVAHMPKGVFLASGFVPDQKVYVGITAFHTFPV